MNSKYLISLQGPTATGKTELAIYLAKNLDTEIISADSRQFYSEMNIGTAKPSLQTLKEARHHFIGFLSVKEKFSAFDFEALALKLLKNIFQKKDCCIITGGSGLYIDAVTKGFDDIPDVDLTIRQNLNKQLELEGLNPLLEQLKELDEFYFNKVDQRNPRRIIRALEVCLTTGRPYSSFLKGEKTVRDFKTIKIGITYPSDALYKRIDNRCDNMISDGLLQEVTSLYPYPELGPLKTIGYQEFFDYLDGKSTLDEAIALFKKHTRHYARRQLSWLRRDKEINWFHPDEREMILQYIINVVKQEV
jgi:tRNA dimethylallyltransferase